MHIKLGKLRDEQVIALLQQHHDDMLNYSPVESIHALDLTGLELPSITFWSLWLGDELAGIGALKELDKEHGKIKSMRTVAKHLRKGIAQKLLQHIIAESKNRSYKTISLETGTNDAFKPAQKLYSQFGFNECDAFSSYKEDPYSLFMTKNLQE
jgi:putative acetyltransferase